jgi:sigma-B regulation protein RsbU (phosphoserine phosphatase)
MLQASLRTQANTIPSVAAILGNINTLVYRGTAVEQFATFFLARVDETRLTLDYSNAGHNYPVVFRKRGGRETLERGGTVVGILESAEFEQGSLALEPGDRVLFYTDGINEAANARGELYGEERLCRLVDSLPADLPARETIERIFEGVRAFLDGTEPGDDMTVMVLRVLEPGTTPAAREIARA